MVKKIRKYIILKVSDLKLIKKINIFKICHSFSDTLHFPTYPQSGGIDMRKSMQNVHF